jgi:hypothetical protein
MEDDVEDEVDEKGGARIRSGFEIRGDSLDTEECTRIVGISPTMVTHKGAPRASGRGVYPFTFWEFELIEPHSYSTDECMAHLIDVIWDTREDIVSFLKSPGLEAGFYSSVRITGERPVYELSAATVKRIAFFGAGYSLDIYDMRPD